MMAVCRATEQDIAKSVPAVLEPHFHVDDLLTIKVPTCSCVHCMMTGCMYDDRVHV